MPIRLVIADDHPLFLSALTDLFLLEKDMEVVASCTNGTDALHAIRQHRPDVASLDVRMPGMNGLEVASALRAENNQTRLILLTAEIDETVILGVLKSGIQGLILKEIAPEMLTSCVRKVNAGERWIEQKTVWHALDNILHKQSASRHLESQLTPREIQLVKMVAQGNRNKEIADKLFISEGTVKTHLHNIYDKLGVNGRLELMRFAHVNRLV